MLGLVRDCDFRDPGERPRTDGHRHSRVDWGSSNSHESLNVCAYVANDPANLIDPTGTRLVWNRRYACVAGNCGWIGYYSWEPDPPTPIGGDLFEQPGGGGSGLGDPGSDLDLPQAQPQQCSAHPLLGALGKIWGGVNTALGVAAAGTSYIAGKFAGTNPNFRFGNNSLQLLNSPLNIHHRAYTLGNVQVYGVGHGPERVAPSYTGAIVNVGSHEEGHTIQSEILGPLYLPAEAAGSLLGNSNPLEAGADRYAQGMTCTGF